MSFEVLSGRFSGDLKEKLEALEEKYVNVNVQAMTFSRDTNTYTLVVKLGEEIHPCTYYDPSVLIDLNKQQCAKFWEECRDDEEDKHN